MRFTIIKTIITAVAPLSFLITAAYAQSTPITGNLNVTGGLKAGTASSTNTAEFRPNGILLLSGIESTDPANMLLPTDLFGNPNAMNPTMLWYPAKSAFHAGAAIWNEMWIGKSSASFGGGIAPGEGSFAAGMAWAEGAYSLATGFSYATGASSSAFGSSMATGEASFASGYSSAEGYASFAGGQAYTIGDLATAFGQAQATAYNSFAVGRSNLGGGNPNMWVATDPLFEIGNGAGWNEEGTEENRSNAVTVFKNGDMKVQGTITCAPAGDIPMYSGN